jgi:hypothetical protein
MKFAPHIGLSSPEEEDVLLVILIRVQHRSKVYKNEQ